MKKYLFLFLIVVAMPIFAQENFTVNLNVGNIGYGGNFPLSDIYSYELIITALNVGIEHQRTHIGVEFYPFKYYCMAGGNKTGVFSLINFNLYWNILNHNFGSDVIYFGPFTSVNYLFLENENFNFDRYIFTAGAQIGFRINIGGINYNLISAEAGYRRINDQNRFFVGGKIDIIAFILTVLVLLSV